MKVNQHTRKTENKVIKCYKQGYVSIPEMESLMNLDRRVIYDILHRRNVKLNRKRMAKVARAVKTFEPRVEVVKPGLLDRFVSWLGGWSK